MMGVGRKGIPICKNWLIYWGSCRKLRKEDIAKMAYVSRVTIDKQLRDWGIQYRAPTTIKSRVIKKVPKEKNKARMPRRDSHFLTPICRDVPPPWPPGSMMSMFFVGLSEFSKQTKHPDVYGFMRQFRKEVKHGRLQNIDN